MVRCLDEGEDGGTHAHHLSILPWLSDLGGPACLDSADIQAAPLWDSIGRKFVGIMVITDFIDTVRAMEQQQEVAGGRVSASHLGGLLCWSPPAAAVGAGVL